MSIPDIMIIILMVVCFLSAAVLIVVVVWSNCRDIINSQKENNKLTKIYTVTALYMSWKEPIDQINPEKIRSRCFGFFPKFKDAEAAVLGNYNDIHENYYRMVVIECFKPGIHGFTDFQVWFEWCDGKFVQTTKPLFTAHFLNWAGIS